MLALQKEPPIIPQDQQFPPLEYIYNRCPQEGTFLRYLEAHMPQPIDVHHAYFLSNYFDSAGP